MDTNIKLVARLFFVVFFFTFLKCREDAYQKRVNQNSANQANFVQFKSKPGLRDFKTTIQLQSLGIEQQD